MGGKNGYITPLDRRVFLAGLCVSAGALMLPRHAFGDPSDEMAAHGELETVLREIVKMQDDLDQATELYYTACEEQRKAELAVASAEGSIAEAERKTEDLRQRLSQRLRSMYRDGEVGFLDVLMESASFDDFALRLDFYERMNDQDIVMMDEMKEMKKEIELLKIDLDEQKLKAVEAADEAQLVKQEAEQTMEGLEERLGRLDPEALAVLEAEMSSGRQTAAAAAQAALRRAVSNGTAGFTHNGHAIPANGSVIDYALSRVGCPYIWAADGPDTFDCSGLVSWAFRQIGIYVPHQTEAQFSAAKVRLPVSEAEPGDVLWVGYGDGFNGHVGIALEAGGMSYVHAPAPGLYVRDTDPLSWAGFTHALRFT